MNALVPIILALSIPQAINCMNKTYNQQATEKLSRAFSQHGIKINMLKEALAENADVNQVITFEHVHKATPLAHAAKLGISEAVETLINAGADVNNMDSGYLLTLPSGHQFSKLTPLIYAIMPDREVRVSLENKLKSLKLLLDNGADVNKQDNFGFTALMEAVKAAEPEIVKLLLDYKADPELKNFKGKTAFDFRGVQFKGRHEAAMTNDKDKIIQELLMRSMRPKFQASIAQEAELPKGVASIVTDYLFGDEPQSQDSLNVQLMQAVERTDISRIAALINAGASVNARDKDRNTPLMHAIVDGNTQLAQLLLKHKDIDVNLVNNGKRTALALAVLNNKPDMVKLLLAKGARVDIQDADKLNAYDHAFGKPVIMKMIENHQNRTVGAEVD